MNYSELDKNRHRIWPWGVFFAGLGFLLILLSCVRPGVFFSGDAGLKFLFVRQMAHTSEFRKIISDHPAWVQQIWEQHYYPFHPVFVYEINGEHWSTFPPYFQALNAYLFKFFGYYGLYIVPCLSIILTWIVFILGLKRSSVPSPQIAFGLFILIFCSPLTFYAAVYWEHSLAVLLVLPAAQWFTGERNAVKQAVIAGVLAGCALWFREESIVFTGLLMALVVYAGGIFRHKAGLYFLIAASIPMLAYFIFNYTAYGYFMGVHGLQITQDRSFLQQLWKGSKLVLKTNCWQVLSFPLIALLLFPLFRLWKNRDLKTNPLSGLTLALVIFSVVVNYILPSDGDKQWGSRFLLLAIPIALHLYLLLVQQAGTRSFLSTRKWLIIPLTGVLLYSFYLNTFQMTRTLRNDYANRIYPALQYIRQDTCANIIIDNQYIAQELTTEFDHKNFFLSDTARPMEPLLKLLKEAGQKECILISVEKEKTPFPAYLMQNKDIHWQDLGSYRIGKYQLP